MKSLTYKELLDLKFTIFTNEAGYLVCSKDHLGNGELVCDFKCVAKDMRTIRKKATEYLMRPVPVSSVVHVEKTPDGYFNVIQTYSDKLLLGGFTSETAAKDWAEECGHNICTLSHTNDNMQNK